MVLDAGDGRPETELWHVTLTVGGASREPENVRVALEQLAAERPFLLSGRYGPDRAEIRYWEEARDCADACALALRVWGEHRSSASLPPWQVLGLEVLARPVHQERAAGPPVSLPLVASGVLRPY